LTPEIGSNSDVTAEATEIQRVISLRGNNGFTVFFAFFVRSVVNAFRL
jgi:hypothetical protein